MFPMLVGVVLVVLGSVSSVIALGLLLHHGYTHSKDPPTSHAKQESCPEVCYFQCSDVGKFSSCNHENWILLCFGVGLLLEVVALFYI